MEDQKREFTGVWIPKAVIEDEDLSMTDKMVYAEIACFDVCFKSNESLGKRYGLKKDTICRVISRLIKKGYVQSNDKTGEYRQLQATFAKSNPRAYRKKILEPIGKKSYRLSDKNPTIDNSIDNNKINNTKILFSNKKIELDDELKGLSLEEIYPQLKKTQNGNSQNGSGL